MERESEPAQRALFDALPSFPLNLNPQLTVLHTNGAYLRVTTTRRGQIPERHSFDAAVCVTPGRPLRVSSHLARPNAEASSTTRYNLPRAQSIRSSSRHE